MIKHILNWFFLWGIFDIFEIKKFPVFLKKIAKKKKEIEKNHRWKNNKSKKNKETERIEKTNGKKWRKERVGAKP